MFDKNLFRMGLSLKAWWNYKCPRCRKGDIFTKPFDIKKPLDMPHDCSHCGQLMEPEPGYYYGAMFLSYIGCSLVMLPIALILHFYFEWSINSAMLFVIALCGVSFFRILRGSRSLWIHLMVKYRPDLAEMNK